MLKTGFVACHSSTFCSSIQTQQQKGFHALFFGFVQIRGIVQSAMPQLPSY